MNQNFKSMSELVPYILSGKKTYTTRLLTPYRAKCNKGDLMHWFEAKGYFFKKELKFAMAIVLETKTWNQKILSSGMDPDQKTPFFNITWREFALAEGFDGIVPMLNFFSQERYIEKDLKTFFFELFVRINTFKLEFTR